MTHARLLTIAAAAARAAAGVLTATAHVDNADDQFIGTLSSHGIHGDRASSSHRE
jgi:hypothetical protein